jgi:hypothetical protein
MLVATRDPLPQPGAHDVALPARGPAREAGVVSRAARFMTVLQMAGSLLAIPVGLASAYSIYRANFSPETACQNLRASIVAMIDKKIDAGTRRMLVGRDVAAFEKTCGAVDPDAVAAFKTLLSADKAPAVVHAAVPAKESPRKADSRPAPPAKREAAPVPAPAPARTPVQTAAAPTVQHDSAVSDTKWLAAVRGALVAPEHSRTVPPTAAPATDAVATASVRPAAKASESAAEPAPPEADAPALPPPTAVASPPAQQSAADHPVPPQAIPDAVTAPSGKAAGFLSHIPFIGQALVR